MDWAETGSLLLSVAGAFVLALPIGWERERSERGLGLRTFPLVAMASTVYLLLAEEVFIGHPEAQARVLQGLITGIGFIGAGAILKQRGSEEVHGTSTAAAVWATGALGASVAYGRWDIAVIISVFTFATFRWMTPLKDAVEDAPRRREQREDAR
ncbi:MAG: MgtC/SapB family protein [Gemmatimonadetes bacterium]|nr:MgtC/SapB family protein [Gemmatimonadota bacterium]